MPIPLKVSDETAAEGITTETVLFFPKKIVTVAELIEQKVKSEVEKYNQTMDGHYDGLVQPLESEKKIRGFSLKLGQIIDLEKQQEAAIQAFSKNGFFLFVNDQQVLDLNLEISIDSKTSVNFIRLVPLVGG